MPADIGGLSPSHGMEPNFVHQPPQDTTRLSWPANWSSSALSLRFAASLIFPLFLVNLTLRNLGSFSRNSRKRENPVGCSGGGFFCSVTHPPSQRERPQSCGLCCD